MAGQVVFNLLSSEWGLQAVRNRRLKISRINDLNDPFEMNAFQYANTNQKKDVQISKERFNRECGLLCFSKSWHNPVMWSHYAHKHRGVCLGFEVPFGYCFPVEYSAKRIPFTIPPDTDDLDEGTAPAGQGPSLRSAATKFADWSYEQEVRRIEPLHQDRYDAASQHYFVSFSECLKLVEVIVGHRSTVSRAELSDALGPNSKAVSVFKARLAFESFRVVRQQDETRWK